MDQAIALYRVSTYRQSVEGHSLEAQEQRVAKAAEYLNATIIKDWKIDASSKVGKNLARKDLHEALAFCKQHRAVRYFIIDEVDRFMRSIKEYYWWQVEFEKLHVKLIFASQPELNEESQFAKLREMLSIYEAEASNAERSRKTTDKMKARVAAGYYPFYPHQGYKSTKAADGLHVPDESRFKLLQSALRAVASRSLTAEEAQIWLHEKGYKTPKSNRKLVMDHWHDILIDPYYAGIIRVGKWPEAKGLHKPMLTLEEYEANVEILAKRSIKRKVRHNPLFPLNTRIRHQPCAVDDNRGKYTGFTHSNGKG